MYVSGTVF